MIVDQNKLFNLKPRKVLNCRPEEIVHLDWSEEWKNNLLLKCLRESEKMAVKKGGANV